MAKNHSKLPITDKSLQNSVVSITLHLTCALEVIISLNRKVIALFHHFFLQFVRFIHIAERVRQKVHNTTTSKPPVACILQILATQFNLYFGRARIGLSLQ